MGLFTLPILKNNGKSSLDRFCHGIESWEHLLIKATEGQTSNRHKNMVIWHELAFLKFIPEKYYFKIILTERFHGQKGLESTVYPVPWRYRMHIIGLGNNAVNF